MYEDGDYMVRKPGDRYKQWKTLETLALSTGMNKENFTAYVVCSGINYGAGEVTLNSHFQSAWLQDPPALPYIGDGENWVPMIHIYDLANIVRFVYESQPTSRYILAIDSNKDSR